MGRPLRGALLLCPSMSYLQYGNPTRTTRFRRIPACFDPIPHCFGNGAGSSGPGQPVEGMGIGTLYFGGKQCGHDAGSFGLLPTSRRSLVDRDPAGTRQEMVLVRET